MIQPTYVYKVLEVLNVYDGDTVTVRVDLGMYVSTVVKLRLLGINAPEMSTPEGRPARDHLRRLVAYAMPDLVIRTYKDPGDKYGRWLAQLWLANACINEQMVSDGYAVQYTP